MRILYVIITLLLVVVLPVSAQDNGKAMDHSKHVGQKIHESMVDAHHFAYHLVDLNKGDTLHLMVYIMDPSGREIEDAKVGFLVKGPDGTTQRAMAMGMKGAYGADLLLGATGTYTIKMKAVTDGGKKFLDDFQYKRE